MAANRWSASECRPIISCDQQFRSALRDYQFALVLGQSVPDFWNALLPDWRADLLQKCRDTERLPWMLDVGEIDE